MCKQIVQKNKRNIYVTHNLGCNLFKIYHTQ